MSEEIKELNIEIPEGYEIDTKKSNFVSGKIVFKPYEFTFEDALKLWNDDKSINSNYTELKNNLPWYLVGIWEMMIWKHCFNKHPKINRENLSTGKYVINMYGGVRQISEDEVQKGTIPFTSYEQADFVSKMMRKYSTSFNNNLVG